MRQAMTKKEKKQLDAKINRVYLDNCANIPIDIFDIQKVFDVGYLAISEGRDLKTAIVEFVNSIRKD